MVEGAGRAGMVFRNLRSFWPASDVTRSDPLWPRLGNTSPSEPKSFMLMGGDLAKNFLKWRLRARCTAHDSSARTEIRNRSPNHYRLRCRPKVEITVPWVHAGPPLTNGATAPPHAPTHSPAFQQLMAGILTHRIKVFFWFFAKAPWALIDATENRI